jgi:AcrR family transcriptional regulator
MASRKKAPVSPRKSPLQARAQDTVEAILEAAARILAEHGSGGLNTNSIASRAGVSIGSLYEYFPGKEAILVALARRQLDGDRLLVMDALVASRGKALVDRAREVVRALIEAHRTDLGVRDVTMTSHREHGFWLEHEEPVRAVAAALATEEGFTLWSRAAIFVLTRAVVGAVRAAACEDPRLLDDPDFEEQVVRLVLGFVAVADAPPEASGRRGR